jgi:GGDEF domain-containing protein
LLRCYDTIGRIENGKLAIVLPGCSTFNARNLAERVRDEVFLGPLTPGATHHLNARYAVVSSGGRSPFVVLRKVEIALRNERVHAAGTIVCVADQVDADFAFHIPVVGPESLRS